MSINAGKRLVWVYIYTYIRVRTVRLLIVEVVVLTNPAKRCVLIIHSAGWKTSFSRAIKRASKVFVNETDGSQSGE